MVAKKLEWISWKRDVELSENLLDRVEAPRIHVLDDQHVRGIVTGLADGPVEIQTRERKRGIKTSLAPDFTAGHGRRARTRGVGRQSGRQGVAGIRPAAAWPVGVRQLFHEVRGIECAAAVGVATDGVEIDIRPTASARSPRPLVKSGPLAHISLDMS